MNTISFSYRRIFLVGLGFFSISVVWQLYNSFMPLMLGDFIESKAVRGFIMGLDNIANIFLIPVIGAWSDRIVNRGYGKRLPFLWAGMPAASLFLMLMPNYTSLWMLILTDIGFLLAMTLFRSPTVSMMPDVTPEAERSQANGIINFMGGVGALIALFVLGPLYDVEKSVPFYTGSAILLAAVLVLTVYLRRLYAQSSAPGSGKAGSSREASGEWADAGSETAVSGNRTAVTGSEPVFSRNETAGAGGEPAEAREGAPWTALLKEVRRIMTGRSHTTLVFTLLAIFFWFVGYSAVEAQFTTYAVEYLGLTEGDASLTLGFFSLTFIVFSIPSGMLARKWGRVRTIRYGIAGLIIAFALMFLIRDLAGIRAVMLFGGLFWALVNIHSYPMIVQHAPEGKLGLYTGVYYLFSSVAASIGPFLLGGVMDLFGYPALFAGALIAIGAAWWCMRRADVQPGVVQP